MERCFFRKFIKNIKKTEMVLGTKIGQAEENRKENVMTQEYLIGLKLSKFNLELSKTEASLCFKAYFKTKLIDCHDDFCLFQIGGDPTQIKACVARLAFAKEAYILSNKHSASADWVFELIDLAKSFNLPLGKDCSFKVNLQLQSKASSEVKLNLINDIAKTVLTNNLCGKISLSKEDLVVFANPELSLHGLLIWTNKDEIIKRRTHLKPAPHPSGIDPRLAKAMINLAGAKNEVLDPFCGAGGILEEVKLLGLKHMGTDISWKLINLARINLHSKENLFCMNAFSWETPVECIVTDLPYGKNSKLDGDLISLIDQFFTHFKPLTNKIVVCTPNNYDVDAISKKQGWSLIGHYDIYIHNSLTRRIHVLEN